MVVRTFRFSFTIPGCSLTLLPPYTADSGVLEYTFPIDEGSVVVTLEDDRGNVQGVPIHQGLQARVDAFGDDLDAARREAEARMEAVLSLIALQGNANVKEAYLKVGYETTPGATTTEVPQVEHYASPLYQKKRQLDGDHLNQLAEAFFVSQRDADPGIARAIRWYRKGLGEDDAIDQFHSYWTGLENLNTTLTHVLHAQLEKRSCKKCGSSYPVHSAKGIRALFIHINEVDGEENFIHCRDLSVAIRHANKSFEQIAPELSSCSDLCRVVLRQGIFLLLGIPIADKDEPVPIYNIHPISFVCRGVYALSPEHVPSQPPFQIIPRLAGIQGTSEERETTWTYTLQQQWGASCTITEAIYFREKSISVQSTSTQSVSRPPTPTEP